MVDVNGIPCYYNRQEEQMPYTIKYLAYLYRERIINRATFCYYWRQYVAVS